jgi:anti-sigma B factor antagonist
VTSAPETGLNIGVDYDDGHAVVALTGEVDFYSCTVLREELTALDGAGHHRIALDLGAMHFCDSSGLGVLVGAVKRAAAGGGGVTLFGAPEYFLSILRVTGLSRVLPAFGERAEALGWLSAQ